MRGFYDIYILSKTQKFDKALFDKAVVETSKHRGTTHILEDVQKRISIIEMSNDLKIFWDKYQKNYSYAKDISFDDIVCALRELLVTVD